MSAINSILSSSGKTQLMPVLFLGHGSPMNAIEENEFVQGFRRAGSDIPRPSAILCISAHWETSGTKVTIMQHPRTIHDFGGFPPDLYHVQYPAPGSPELAGQAMEMVTSAEVKPDDKWGLDHGAWSVIKHLYPEADVPVVQMSLNINMKPEDHYLLARQLKPLREKGVLLIGSGNMVHNLGLIAWDKMSEDNYGYDWAIEAGTEMKRLILAGDHKSLISLRDRSAAFRKAIPTPEHYLPLLYALALTGNQEQITLFNDKYVAGSLVMTSANIG